jgi:chemotaxis protein methyltransferase CheR
MSIEKALPSTISEPLLTEFSSFLAEQIGIRFLSKRWPDLLQGMVALAEELDFPDVESCMRSLMRVPLSRYQVEFLASQFSVGETYFFRDPAVFDALEQEILPSLIAARRGDGNKRLRIWSAGCCSGEEAYSIAILINRLLSDLDSWNITILGTDINAEFLKKAELGIYREWSFRSGPALLRQRYFSLLESGNYVIQPHIRRLVTFGHLNLVGDIYPAFESNTNAMDIILCRNVLMYFEHEQIVQVVRNLHHALVDGGWLIVSATEAGMGAFSEFTPVRFPSTTFYRKGDAGKQQESAEAHGPDIQNKTRPPAFDSIPDSDASYRSALIHYEHGAYEKAVSVLSTGRCRQPKELMLLARSYANCGRLEDAATWCEAAIAMDKCSPGLRYLHAIILEEQGALEPAVAALKRALYLDQNFVLAHFALGNFYRRQSKQKEATRHFELALALLQSYPQEEILPESEGMTAGRLTEIIRTREETA